MALEAYDHFWSTAMGYSDNKRRRRMAEIRNSAGIDSGFGGAGDPLGAQTAMVQNSMLGQLARRASGENGRIDDWESLVDPTVSYGSNLRTILQKGGKELDSTIEDDRENWIESADDRQTRHAKATIRENLESLEAGEASHLRDDLVAEFSEDFLEAAIAEAKLLEEPEPDIEAPEPTDPEPVETPESPAEEPEPVATVDSSPSQTNLEDVETPEPVESPEPEEPVAAADPSPAEPDYSGVTGAIQLVGEFLAASFRAGQREAAPESTTNANEAV